MTAGAKETPRDREDEDEEAEEGEENETEREAEGEESEESGDLPLTLRMGEGERADGERFGARRLFAVRLSMRAIDSAEAESDDSERSKLAFIDSPPEER